MKKLYSIIVPIFITLTLPVYADELSPLTVDGATTIDSSKAKSLFDDGVLFVDIRKNSDWDAGRIPDALYLELNSQFTAENLAAEVYKNEALVCYCNGPKCHRSAKCAAKAVEWGFSNIYYYREGFPAWKAAGYPVE
jgi:rhodanese-related sulfurtransferase